MTISVEIRGLAIRVMRVGEWVDLENLGTGGKRKCDTNVFPNSYCQIYITRLFIKVIN